jgi:putative AlgH/UPF0301 family transcriptional regulator
MDQSFPDATEEDLQRGDHTCIICREEMSTAGGLVRWQGDVPACLLAAVGMAAWGHGQLEETLVLSGVAFPGHWG